MEIPIRAAQKKFWTHKTASKEALKYSTRNEFRVNSGGAYRYACYHKILDSICAHMEQFPKQKWTTENLLQEAKKYTNRKDFKQMSPKAYALVENRRITEYICAHMDEYRHIKGNNKLIKKLSKFDNAMYQETNEARIAIGLKPLEIKVRICLSCKVRFESIGDRICGCTIGHVTNLAGIEVV